MKLIQWTEERARRLTIWDTGVLKTYCVLIGMVFGAYVPAFVTRNVAWFLGAVVVLSVFYVYRFLTATPADTRT